jgi:single-strand DNA-binding protein
MSGVNHCTFIGNLGRDPEVRTFGSGEKVCNLRLAVSETWKDRNTGERREATEWVTVAIFGPLADIAEKFLRKGSKVYIAGKMKTRKWQDQTGADRYSTEIVLQGPGAVMQMLDGKPERDDRPDDRHEDQRRDQAPARDIDDEIPF